MSRAEPRLTRLEDYTPPPFLIDTVELWFELDVPSLTFSTTL